MEFAIPIIAVAGLFISKKTNKKIEQFENLQEMMNGEDTNPENEVIDSAQNTDEINGAAQVNASTEHPYTNSNNARDSYFNGSRTAKSENVNKQTVYNMKGEEINTTTFKHNNMQPFFGGKIKGIQDPNTSESILDNMTGSGSQKIKKQEQAPLFKPLDNLHNTYGAPNVSDFYQSRVNESNRHANVKPFESIQVAPGLNKGFTAEGGAGFNSGMEERCLWEPKTVDELRVKTNPKNSYELSGHQGPANSYNKHISDTTHIGKVEQHKPDTFFHNGSERWFTTGGIEKGQTNRAIVNLPDSNRADTTTSYSGVAGSDRQGVNYQNQEFQESNRNSYGSTNLPSASATGRNQANKDDFNKSSFKNYRTNRDAKNDSHLFGNIGSALTAAIAPLVDILKPSRKENTIGNGRLYGEFQSQVPKSYTHNPNDRVKITNRQMEPESKNHHNVQNQNSGAYQVTNPDSVYQSRQDSTTYYAGNGHSQHKESTSYASAYEIQSTPYKEETLGGRAPNGNTNKLNHKMNVNMAKVESDRDNNRMWVPNTLGNVPPTKEVHGQFDMPNTQDTSMEAYNNDRIDPGLLNAFKANPYTHALNST